MEYEFYAGGQSRKVVISRSGGGFTVDAGFGSREVEYYPLTPNSGIIIIDNHPSKVYFVKDNRNHYLHINGNTYAISERTGENDDSPSLDSSLIVSGGEICAPMPGKILKILVKKGDRVTIKQSLLIVESMKMEHEVRSPLSGTVMSVNFTVNELVNAGQPIIVIEPDIETE